MDPTTCQTLAISSGPSGNIQDTSDVQGVLSNRQTATTSLLNGGPKGRSARRKKKKRVMEAAAPAKTVIKGFQTPPTSGDDDSSTSACATPNFRSTPISGSPASRPSCLTRAISNLQLDTVDSKQPSKQPHESRSQVEHRSWRMPKDVLEDNLELRESVCLEKPRRPIYGAIEGGLRHDSPHRKMTASDFQTLKCLGKGAYGTVILVRQQATGRLFAQKQLKKASLTAQKRLIEQTKTERAILENVKRHPFVVKLYYAFQDRQRLYLILEYAQGGELFHHLALERTFTEDVAAFYMAELVIALDHLHREQGVVYRDLKPENCLLDAEGHLLLTDFGLSKLVSEDPEFGKQKCDSILGTIDYMAPEVIQGKPYDAAVDWWSLGALGYDLLTGSPPFSSGNHAKTQQKIVHGKLNPPYYLSPDAKDLFLRLLRKEPRKRLGGNMPKDFNTLKSHRFFRKIDWRALEDRELIAPIQPIITDPAAAENFDSEFTNIAVSPIEGGFGETTNVQSFPNDIIGVNSPVKSPEDHFGGFSYVASRSLLEAELE